MTYTLYEKEKEMPLYQTDLSTIDEQVLVVDDDTTLLELLHRQLTSFGLQAKQSSSAMNAVTLLQKQSYGLVITDIAMPEMDGMELLRHIKTQHPDIDVLAISGYSNRYNFTDLVHAGASDFITKPFDINELEAKLQRIFHERFLKNELANRKKTEKKFFLHIVESLAISLDEKDAYTHGHSKRVTNLALQLAECTTEEPVDVELLRLCAVLHDIGKIGIPDKILGKIGPLTSKEYDVIKKHPEKGAQILGPMESDSRISLISTIIKHHHERYDGTGYPDGLQGEEIPYFSRLIAITDSYDAMTSDRPYRKGMEAGTALEEIHKHSGSQFDPTLARKFIDIMEKHMNSAPCPTLEHCPIFNGAAPTETFKAYEMQYCRANFKSCARFKIKNTAMGHTNILPDGSYAIA